MAVKESGIADEKKIGKDTDAYAAYSQGRLPPAHIHARAKRYAIKLFLAHLHHKMYMEHYGKEPPLPYAIAHLDHAQDPGRESIPANAAACRREKSYP